MTGPSDDLAARLIGHRAHAAADSLFGRCTVCGLTWAEQTRAIQAEAAGRDAPVDLAEAEDYLRTMPADFTGGRLARLLAEYDRRGTELEGRKRAAEYRLHHVDFGGPDGDVIEALRARVAAALAVLDAGQRAEFPGTELSDRLRAVLDGSTAPTLAEPADCHSRQTAANVEDEHRYLSTGCLHGRHAYCQAAQAEDAAGEPFARRPSQCKFCAAPCVCSCHAATASDAKSDERGRDEAEIDPALRKLNLDLIAARAVVAAVRRWTLASAADGPARERQMVAALERHDERVRSDMRAGSVSSAPETPTDPSRRSTASGLEGSETPGVSFAPDPAAPPPADWSSVWAELSGYVWRAAQDGTQIDPSQLSDYLAELKHRALAPVREYLAELAGNTAEETS